MPLSVKAYFDQKVPAALAAHPDKAKDVAAVYLFKVSGPDGGLRRRTRTIPDPHPAVGPPNHGPTAVAWIRPNRTPHP